MAKKNCGKSSQTMRYDICNCEGHTFDVLQRQDPIRFGTGNNGIMTGRAGKSVKHCMNVKWIVQKSVERG